MFSEINTYITQMFYIRNTSNDYVMVGWRQQSNTTVWNFDYVVLLEARVQSCRPPQQDAFTPYNTIKTRGVLINTCVQDRFFS